MKRVLFVVAAAALLCTAVALSAAPKLPAKAAYTGKTSQGKVIRLTISKNATRIDYRIFVRVPCAKNFNTVETNWSTLGKFYDDFWIRPRANGTFSYVSRNGDKFQDGTSFKAVGRITGRFATASAVSGTFRGHVDYFKMDGSPLTQCDTGPVTWSAKR